jgi:cytochrome c
MKTFYFPRLKVKKLIALPGQNLFQTNCAVCACSKYPPGGAGYGRISTIYKNNLEGLKKWIKEPGRKRLDYPAMAGFPHLSDQQLTKYQNICCRNNGMNE